MPAAFVRTTRALQADSPRLALAAWCTALIGLLAWAGWFVLGSVTVIEVSNKARLEVQATPHAMMADLSGKLEQTRLRIGQPVQAGEVLVVLDSSRLQAQRREEVARLDAIGPRLSTLQREMAGLAQARTSEQRAAEAAVQAATARAQEASAGADFAQNHERRLSAEHQAGGIAEIDALRVRTEARRLRFTGEALAAEARRLGQEARTRDHQMQAQIDALQRQAETLQGEAAASRATLARLDQDILRHQLRAPVAGLIGEVAPLSPGAFVPEGQRLATIVPAGDLLVVAEFDPASAMGRIQPGQAARLRLDGFPWAQYGMVEAQVLRVAGELRDQRLRVELRPLSPVAQRGTQPPRLQHGLTGSVEVMIERTSPAVLVLRAAGQLAAPAAARTAAQPAGPTP